MAAEGGAEGIQGQPLLAFWELGRGGGECCSLEELLGNLSSLLGTFFPATLIDRGAQP